VLLCINLKEEDALTVRIMLAIAHQRMFESLHALIDRDPGMEVVTEAHDEQTVLRLVGDFNPDVAVIDVSMLDRNSFDTVRKMISVAPATKLLVLSMYSYPEFVDAMFKTGVSGLLLKDHAFKELVRAIQKVANGGIFLSPAIKD